MDSEFKRGKGSVAVDAFKNEIWKDIPGHDGFYQVSNYGRVRTFKKRGNFSARLEKTKEARLLKPSLLHAETPCIFISRIDGTREWPLIKMLVAEMFIPEYNRNKHSIENIDGNKLNNHYLNLKLVERQEYIPVCGLGDDEIWKDIEDYDGVYKISNYGRVRSYKNKIEIILFPKDTHGYLTVYLLKNRTKKRVGVHRLVAIAFLPNLENKPEVNHRDGNKKNNHVNNLEWNTSAENIRHALDTGLANSRIGENHKHSIMTVSDALLIKEARVNNVPLRELVRKFSQYTMANIYSVYTGVTWNHIHVPGFEDAIKGPAKNKGNEHYLAKISGEEVRSIKKLKVKGIGRQEILAKFPMYNEGIVDKILNGSTWGHLIVPGFNETLEEKTFKKKQLEKDVRFIKELKLVGISFNEIVEKFPNYNKRTLRGIFNGKYWKYILPLIPEEALSKSNNTQD